MGMWRAGCGANSHVRFGGRARETDRLEGRHRALVRPYDTDENVERFGRPPSSRGDGRGGAFPQIRVLGLAECGSHAIIDAALGSYKTGEQTLAEEILRSLQPGRRVLADRGFFSYPLWKKAAATGVDLLWRIKSNAVLPVQTRYPDVSFSSHIYPGTTARRNKVDGIAVRVIEYHLDATAVTDTADDAEPDSESRTYRLLTTITDPALAPAEELAELYFQRWEIETAFGELKTHQRGAGVVLRSKLADGVIQEVYGYLCVHYAIRWLMHSVATDFGKDQTGCRSPDPSGPHGEPLPATRVFPPDTLADASHTVTDEILTELLPARTHRANPRVVKHKMSVYQVKHPHHRGAAPIRWQLTISKT